MSSTNPVGTSPASGTPTPSTTTRYIDPDSNETAAGPSIPDVPMPPSTDTPEPTTGTGGSEAPQASAVADSYEGVDAVTTPAAPGSPGASAWTAEIEERFRAALVSEEEIAVLKNSNYDRATLEQMVALLERAPLVDPQTGEEIAPAGGSVAAGSGSDPYAEPGTQPAGGVDPAAGTGAADATGGTGAASGGLMSGPGDPAWDASFARIVELLPQLGLTPQEAEQQAQMIRESGMSDAELKAVIAEAESVLAQDASAGAGTSTYVPGAAQGVASTPAWTQEMSAKFAERLDKIDQLSPEQKQQYLQGMAMSGKSADELNAEYDRLGGFLPGWSNEWAAKFEALDVSKELLGKILQGASSGPGQTPMTVETASEDALKSVFDTMITARKEARENGRLDKLKDADANAEELWNGVLGMKDVKADDFNKYVDSVKSQHVPAWKRVLSIGLNFVPGWGAVNWIAGKDLVTGENIDRGNLFNIGMAVLSVLPAVSWGKGAINGVRTLNTVRALDAAGDIAKGASAMNGVANAAEAGVGVSRLSKFMTSMRSLGAASPEAAAALNASGAASRLAGVSKWDAVKSALPILNRVGRTGQIASDLKNARQVFQLANQHAAIMGSLSPALAGQIDKVAKFENLSEASRAAYGGGPRLQALSDEILQTTGFRASDLARVDDFLKSGNGVHQSAALWRFNPAANQSTVSVAGDAAAAGKPGLLSRLANRVTGGRAGNVGARLTPQAQEGALVLGRGAELGTRAGYIQAAGALEAAATGSSSIIRTAEIAARAGITPVTGMRRLAQLPSHFLRAGGGSNNAVQRSMSAAADAQKAQALLDAGKLGVMVRGTADGLPHTIGWALSHRAVAGAGTLIGSGYVAARSGFPSAQIQAQSNAADAQVAMTEAQLRALGIDPNAAAAGDLTEEEEALIRAEEERIAAEQAGAGSNAGADASSSDGTASAGSSGGADASAVSSGYATGGTSGAADASAAAGYSYDATSEAAAAYGASASYASEADAAASSTAGTVAAA